MSTVPADVVASDLLRAAGLTAPPMRVERVAALLHGLVIAQEPLDHDGYIVPVPGGAEILVNSRASPPRQRFTIAHEIGHYALQIGLGDASHLAAHAELERWCDRFAVSLLMPREWVKAFVAGVPSRKLAARVSRGPQIFEVSRQAFWARVTEVAPMWTFELTGDGDVASEVRPPPPPEVVNLAKECVTLTHSETLAAGGLRASCVRLKTTQSGGERSLAVVAADESVRRAHP